MKHFRLLSFIWTIGLVASSSDHVSAKVFECCELSLACEAAPVVRFSPEVLDKIILVLRSESAMFAWKSPRGNVIGWRCVSILLGFTTIGCKILEQIFSCRRLTRSCIPLVGHLKCASWCTGQAPVAFHTDL